MSEQWKPVTGYEDYEVSSEGRVRHAFQHISGKIVWRMLNTNNRSRSVRLYRNGEHIKRPIAQLILEAFVGPSPVSENCQYVAHHIDGNNYNSNLNNLEWRERIDALSRRGFRGNSKLTDAERMTIFNAYQSGVRTVRLAADWDISLPLVYKIIQEKQTTGI